MNWSIVQSDAIAWLASLEDDSADLLVCSPPYETARTYGIDFNLRGQAWVDWMVEIVKAASPKVKGLIAIVCDGQTRKFAYSATPFLLVADLHRAGFNLRKPAAFHRVGIPGSGGPDWLRNDYEPIICITRPGKLPWSDTTALGHAPKWAPGGAMSNRTEDGVRKNARDKPEARALRRQTHFAHAANGTVKGPHARDIPREGRRITKQKDGMHKGQENTIYSEPVLANPGNVIEATYTIAEVHQLLTAFLLCSPASFPSAKHT